MTVISSTSRSLSVCPSHSHCEYKIQGKYFQIGSSNPEWFVRIVTEDQLLAFSC